MSALLGCVAVGCGSAGPVERVGEIPSGGAVCIEHPSGAASGQLCLTRVEGQLRVEASGLEPLALVAVVDEGGNRFESKADLDGKIDAEVSDLADAPYRATSVWVAAGPVTLGTGTN